jgi:hypothetical protein
MTIPNHKWRRALCSFYFWIPSLLAVLDLAFYSLIPFILFSFFAPVSETSSGGLQLVMLWAADTLALGKASLTFTLVFALVTIRIVGTKIAEHLFANSIAKHYTHESSELLGQHLSIVAQCKNVDIPKVRKAINAEISNLYFGFQLPSAFIGAELLLLLAITSYATLLFGPKVLLLATSVSITIFLIFYFIRKQSAAVGEARSTFEQQRLETTEIALGSAFSIGINGGDQYLLSRFSMFTKDFSHALGRQVVLPYSTKALIDGALVGFVYLLLTQGEWSFSPGEMAVLGGMLVRTIPSLSRISSYVETMRINAVALFELRAAVDSTHLLASAPRHEKLYDALCALPSTGMFFVVGASGIGKTTTIKQWVTEIKARKSVAYLEQTGFVSGATIPDYFALVGLDSDAKLKTEKWLTSYDIKGEHISHLSGGQSKFLQFVAISHKRKDVYVFDEPTVGLDAELQAVMKTFLVELSKNALVVAVSHDRAFVESLIQNSSGEIIEVS